MTTRYRVAGINFAHMHMGDNLRFAFDHPDVDLVGICDDETARMESALEAFGLGSDQVFTDWQRCLAEPRPDLVILCSPTGEHPHCFAYTFSPLGDKCVSAKQSKC